MAALEAQVSRNVTPSGVGQQASSARVRALEQ
jgi:hypothetical protein